MKKLKRKQMLRGLQNIRSNYYCDFSEKEHLIISSVIAHLKKQKPKSKWTSTTGEVLKGMAAIVRNMF